MAVASLGSEASHRCSGSAVEPSSVVGLRTEATSPETGILFAFLWIFHVHAYFVGFWFQLHNFANEFRIYLPMSQFDELEKQTFGVE